MTPKIATATLDAVGPGSTPGNKCGDESPVNIVTAVM